MMMLNYRFLFFNFDYYVNIYMVCLLRIKNLLKFDNIIKIDYFFFVKFNIMQIDVNGEFFNVYIEFEVVVVQNELGVEGFLELGQV